MRLSPSVLLLLAASSAAGAMTEDDGTCRNGIFPVQNEAVRLATIAGSGRAYFLGDMDGCPNAEARCRQRTYVVPGDRVVAGRSRGGYVCVYYPSRGGGSAGWMEVGRLEAVATDPNPPLSAWLGSWSEDGNPRVTFERRGSGLAVEGEAYWPSRNPSPRDYPGGPNEGTIGEILQVSGNRAHAPECHVRFTLLGDFIVAADPDMQCGGMNVSFSGVYRRVRR
jgi:hypothetical protein